MKSVFPGLILAVAVSLPSLAALKEGDRAPEFKTAASLAGKEFVFQHCAGKVPVASDADGKIARSFELKVADEKKGARNTQGDEIGHGFAERTTFVVTPDGKIAAVVGGLAPAENVTKALEAVQHLKKS